MANSMGKLADEKDPFFTLPKRPSLSPFYHPPLYGSTSGDRCRNVSPPKKKKIGEVWSRRCRQMLRQRSRSLHVDPLPPGCNILLDRRILDRQRRRFFILGFPPALPLGVIRGYYNDFGHDIKINQKSIHTAKNKNKVDVKSFCQLL